MIIRNGIRSTLRAKGRTVLFTLLILVLTLALTLGMGAWAYSAALLAQMDSAYQSIALVEYMGADYPDRDAADLYSRLSVPNGKWISDIDGVQLWEQTDRSLANLEGYTRLTGEIPYEDRAVLLCTSFTPLYEDGWVTYEEKDMPDTFVMTDQVNWQAQMRRDGIASGWVPFYRLMDGKFISHTAYDMQTGESSYQVTPEEELPATYIYQQNAGWNNVYYYIRDGVQVRSIQENTRGGSAPIFTYDPESGIVSGPGKVVKSYTGICVDPLYSREYDGEFLLTLQPDQLGLEVKPKTRYVLHGYFSPKGNNHNNFVLTPFYEGCETLPWQEVTEGQYDPVFDQYAEIYATANNYVRLEASRDVEALEVFQQNTLRLQQGRFPAAGEADACVVSYDIAQQLQLELGDSMDLTVLNSREDDRFQLTAAEEKQLTVVGIATTGEDHHGCVWVSDAEGGFAGPIFGYQLGRAVLENEKARQAADAIQSFCGDNVRVTLYDQGYSAAAQPMQTMRTTAMAVTLAAACATVAVLLLFAYLFVGRQKETVQVLVSLGTPTGKIRLWLLSGAALICALAAAVGAAGGSMALESILTMALDGAKSMYTVDQRYSEAAIGFIREAETAVQLPVWPAAAAFCGVFLLALLLCLVFLRFSRKQNTPKRGKQTVRVPKSGTSVRGKGALRFALLSAKRGGWRSVIVPVAVLVLSFLLGILAVGAQGWDQQLESLYADTKLQGMTVSTNGRQSTGLQVGADSARALWKSGLLSDMGLSVGWNYYFDQELPDFGIGEFAEYARQKWIADQPRIIALNHLQAAPEFMHSGSSQVTWLEGWDQRFLRAEYDSFPSTKLYFEMGTLLEAEHAPIAYPCLVSEDFLTGRGLALGDTFQITMNYKHYIWESLETVSLYPVGTFTPTAGQRNIYVPLSFWCSESWITGETDLIAPGERVTMQFHSNLDRDKFFYNTTTFGTCVFTLKQAEDLDALRDYLQSRKFSQVGKLTGNRTTVMLKDQTFVETVGGLNRYISFSQLLFPVLFGVVALLGFIISWLMVNGRRMEFAILRGLGASRIRVFLTFFTEQLLLCLLGCLISVAALWLLTGWGQVQPVSVGIFALCYLAGCALSVLAVGRTKLLSLLSERE